MPKLRTGIYQCVRGEHCLHNGLPFTTFEITGVTGHTNILFHAGNFNTDSEGCVLLGQSVVVGPDKKEMIANSKKTFAKFMELQKDVNTFQLTVL